MTQRPRSLPAWTSPVLESVRPVVEAARHVAIDADAVDAVARWMAYEDFDVPLGGPQFDVGLAGDDLVDWTLVNDALNFAFTDFETGHRFDTAWRGETWADSDAMHACFARALAAGVPVLDGAWMARVDRAELNRIFDGTIEMPMLDRRVEILNEVVNALRPADMQLVIPRIDYRLWSKYHATFAPHHLTETIMY